MNKQHGSPVRVRLETTKHQVIIKVIAAKIGITEMLQFISLDIGKT